MIRYLFVSAAALALMTGGALAQNSYSQSTTVTQSPPAMSATPPDQSASAPADTDAPDYSKTTTTRTIDANGVETNSSESVRKSQSVNDENGELRSRTTVERSNSTSTVAPPGAMMPSETTTTTTTTSGQE
jgi:hypothetical protein